MKKFKTYFEQVPLETVNKIVEQQSGEEELTQETIMSGGEFEFPKWQAPLQELILEFDREKFREKLTIVESAILERLRQLDAKNGDRRERQVLSSGLSIISAIAGNRHA